MKKILCVILVFSLVFPLGLFAQSAGGNSEEVLSPAESYNRGAMDAKVEHSSAGWAVAGVVSGGLFSLLGAGITLGIAAASSPSPDYLPSNVDLISYQRGFEKAARKKNITAAAIAGSIMSALWITVVAASQ